MGKQAGGRIRVALVAGEASGDLLGSHLLAALRQQLPELEACGIGGPKMQSAGLDSWYPMEWFAVRGYVEVLRSLPRLLRVSLLRVSLPRMTLLGMP